MLQVGLVKPEELGEWSMHELLRPLSSEYGAFIYFCILDVIYDRSLNFKFKFIDFKSYNSISNYTYFEL